jgi:hypothetical protein
MAADKSVIKRQRDRHFWQQQVEAWQQSGLKPSRYANQHRLCKAQFERWRYRLKREAKSDVDFIPVQVEPPSSATHQHLVISGPSGLMHSSLAVTTAGLPLGLAAIKFWTRKHFKGTDALKRHINPTRMPDDGLLQQMQALIQRIDKKDLQDLLGSELTSQAAYFFNTSLILKGLKLIEIKKFCDKLLKPHFTEQGSLIFKLSDNLQNHAKKSENDIEGISPPKQTNSAYGRLFQPSSSNSAKILETQDGAGNKSELVQIEETQINQAM